MRSHHKAEEAARQWEAAEDQQQVEHNKRMLEVQLTQNESDPGGIDSNYIYIHIHKEIDAPKSKQDSLVTEEWNQPEEIENVVSLLTECDCTPGRNPRCSIIIIILQYFVFNSANTTASERTQKPLASPPRRIGYMAAIFDGRYEQRLFGNS
ncbi:MAG: hypothetical protein KME22_05640 [Hassallia sp. WJT32-NPBG1]|nr:hypothetical protein [Hassallia sp. WJT32-NPBG1]